MRDVVFVALVLAFFALSAAYIRACAAIVGRDAVVDIEPSDASEPGDEVAEVLR